MTNAVRRLRARAGVTQARLARAGGTSQPTISTYESGRKTPTIRTLGRLARAVGLELSVDFITPLTREDRRSLALHRVVIERLRAAPVEVVGRARRTLALMLEKHPNAHPLLREWDVLLDRPLPDLINVLRDPHPRGRALRQVSPFAGTLTPADRADVYRRFRISEEEDT